MTSKNIILLGATGSIGKSTLNLIRQDRDKFNLIGIPYQLILGNKTEGDLFEFKEINGETQKLSIEDAVSQILKAKSN